MKQNQALVLFALAVILAAGIFWYLWTMQINYGRTVEGARNLGELWLRREALTAQQPSGEMMNIIASKGCCNFLERPSMGSQLMIDVAPGSGKCYEDALTQSRVKSGYVIVDIEPRPCPKRIA